MGKPSGRKVRRVTQGAEAEVVATCTSHARLSTGHLYSPGTPHRASMWASRLKPSPGSASHLRQEGGVSDTAADVSWCNSSGGALAHRQGREGDVKANLGTGAMEGGHAMNAARMDFTADAKRAHTHTTHHHRHHHQHTYVAHRQGRLRTKVRAPNRCQCTNHRPHTLPPILSCT